MGNKKKQMENIDWKLFLLFQIKGKKIRLIKETNNIYFDDYMSEVTVLEEISTHLGSVIVNGNADRAQ